MACQYLMRGAVSREIADALKECLVWGEALIASGKGLETQPLLGYNVNYRTKKSCGHDTHFYLGYITTTTTVHPLLLRG